MAEVCVWMDLFDNREREILHDGFAITGFMAVVLITWVNLALMFTNLRADPSYRNLLTFTMAAYIRRLVSMFPYLPIIGMAESWRDQKTEYELSAFLETFLAVLEVEGLTHVCIERYVAAKYFTKGWPIQTNHYMLFPCLCLFFSGLYSFPPSLGLGGFGYDFSCTSYTFDMVLPDTWEKYFIALIFFFRSVKPAIVMIAMLIWARILEDKLNPAALQNHLRFTQAIIVVTAVNLLSWLPIGVIRGWVVTSYLLYNAAPVMPSAFYIKWAMWLHWFAPAPTAIALFTIDKNLRFKMINVCNNDVDKIEEKKE